MEVGAILSQRSPSDNKVHPCAFFSHQLTPMDFVTGLPPSSGNTVVLTVVDRFSKRFISFPSPNYPQRGRQQSLSLITSSASMATKVLNPVTVRLKLHPLFKRINPVFHVSGPSIKPVIRSPSNPRPLPLRLPDSSRGCLPTPYDDSLM